MRRRGKALPTQPRRIFNPSHCLKPTYHAHNMRPGEAQPYMSPLHHVLQGRLGIYITSWGSCLLLITSQTAETRSPTGFETLRAQLQRPTTPTNWGLHCLTRHSRSPLKSLVRLQRPTSSSSGYPHQPLQFAFTLSTVKQ
jgi:hypothetical protein